MSLVVRGSLRRRLLLSLLASLAVVWVLVSLITVWETSAELDELLDGHLAQSAALLIAQLGHEPEEIELEHLPLLHKYAHRVAFQVWEGGDRLRLHSSNAPNRRLTDKDHGFADARHEGKGWRVFSRWDEDHRYLVQIGEAAESRGELVEEMRHAMLPPVLFSLPVFGVAIWLAVGRGLRPLARVREAIAGSDPRSLSPLGGEAPIEIAPLIEQLNRLFARVESLLESERRFTADAAHELRTPLAALKTQAQVALGAVTTAERDQALHSLSRGCDRAAHLVEQLLTLARLEAETWRANFVVLDLHALAAQVMADMLELAMARQIEMALQGEGRFLVRGNAGLLGILLRNLLDNALRYGPLGSHVVLRLERGPRQRLVHVIDQGPGISEDERDKVRQRFYRSPGTEAPGSGLGLSIVERIAEIHDGYLELRPGAGGMGLEALIGFPRADD